MPATHHPLATQLAETLRIVDPDTPHLGPKDKASFLETINNLYETVEEDEMEVIHASFCARFLPALVDAYKSAPDVLGPYTKMLRVVLDSGYFAKFMRGALGSDLYMLHAERLVEMKLSADIDVEVMESAVVMLVFLMVYSDHYHRTIPPLAEPLKDKLAAKMVTLQNYYGPKLKQVPVRRGQVPSRRARLLESIVRNAGDAERFLTGRLASANMLGAVGRMMPWITCGGYDTGCWAKGKQKGRLGCARCETQTYCSKEHQKADWPAHKRACFETVY
ncbi:hypothetical protein C8J57DRAFT_1331935 [Mycena rebaudengoi]|nr:hypothetical protein C8J57DRAFT_1331935 [Mycena rebaudengoi]